MLDFGQGNSSSHQSYYQNEEGAWVENVYQPLAETEHPYDQTIRNMIGTIRADASGVSQGKADRIAKGLLPGYLDSFIGDQHFRKLTQIEGMSEEEAIEFFDYNVAGGYIGKYQPLIIDDTGV